MRSVTKKLIKFSLRKKLSSISKREDVIFIVVIGGVSRALTRDRLKNILSERFDKVFVNQPGFNHKLGLPLTVFGAVQRVGSLKQLFNLLISKRPVKPGIYILEFAMTDEKDDLDFLLNDSKPEYIIISDLENNSFIEKDDQKYLSNFDFILKNYQGILIYPKAHGYDLFKNKSKIGEYSYTFSDTDFGQDLSITSNNLQTSLKIDGHGEPYSKAATIGHIISGII